jgi:catechol 2,3-dioxygenase-like lactoylglutathione lyase family enzyme
MNGMPSGIDHVVIAVPDLEAAVAEVTQRVGLAFTSGGRHAGLGTVNRIAFLGDAYLELIAVEDRAQAKGWAIGAAAVRALEGGGGFATWALADAAIRATVPRLQANGSHIGAVTHGSRERPDGERVEWWSATPPELGPDRPPLLIKHLEAGVEWGAEARSGRRAFVHPIGSAVRLDGLDLAVSDPIALAARCRSEVGLDFAWDGAAAVASVGRQAIRLTRGTVGKATIRIAAAVEAAQITRLLGVRFAVRPSAPL